MIYVCADIHGLYPVYQQAVNLLTPEDKLYILGDVIDRGADGIKILKDIMMRDNVELIIGNHECLMLSALYEHNEDDAKVWKCVANSGGITNYMFKQESKETQQEILNYLLNCRLAKKITVNGQKYCLTHSGPIPEGYEEVWYKDADQDLRFAITWYSPFRTDELQISPEAYLGDCRYIVGHVPTQKLGHSSLFTYGGVIIDIDCGCANWHLRPDTSLCVLCLDTLKAQYFKMPEKYEDTKIFTI